MAKIDPLDDVGSLANTTSARAVINSNSQKIEDAFANTVSRDGSAPNQMEADFDLNDHYLLNVADPVNEADGVNLRSVRPLVEQFAAQIVETAVFGTQVVDSFTAMPGQTDFPLSESPGSIENVSLFIDELAKLPSKLSMPPCAQAVAPRRPWTKARMRCAASRHAAGSATSAMRMRPAPGL